VTLRYYSAIATDTTLAANVTIGTPTITTTVPLTAANGYPSTFPFSIALSFGIAIQEIVDVTAVSGTTATVTRGINGTSAQVHFTADVIRHVFIARDATDANVHINATAGVHGIAGNVVGDTDVQTLTNKTIAGYAPLASPTFTGTVTDNGNLIINNQVAGTVGAIIKGFTSQTADLLQAQNSAGTVITSIGAGGALVATGLNLGAPNIQTVDYTLVATDVFVINNKAATAAVYTLGTATAGKLLFIDSYTVFGVNSASSNVIPKAGGAAGTTIIGLVAGASAMLIGDGSNFRIVQ
jgi:hypothetical protein